MRGLLITFVATVLALLLRSPRDAVAQGTDPATVIQQYTDAVNAKDVDTALSLLADDATIATAHGYSFSGKADLRTFLQLGASGGGYHTELVGKRQVSGDTVTWTEKVSFAKDQSQQISVAVVQGGKIKSITSTLVIEPASTITATAAPTTTAMAEPTQGTPTAVPTITPSGSPTSAGSGNMALLIAVIGAASVAAAFVLVVWRARRRA